MKILFLGYDARYEILISLLSNRYEIDSIGYNNSNKSISDIKNINDYKIVVLIYTGNTKGLKGNVDSFLSV